MSIKARIRLFQMVVTFAIAAVSVVAVIGIRSSTFHRERVQYAREQLTAMTELAVYANRYSEQVAEVLLIGEPERPEFESARAQVTQTFIKLRRIIAGELAFVRGDAEHRFEVQELDQLDRMQIVFREVDQQAEQVFVLDKQGRRDEAIALFRSDIENRLDAEFERLIAAAVAGERDEVARVDAHALAIERWLTAGTFALLGLMLAGTTVTSVRFARALHRPIDMLTAGASAVEQGDLTHRIGYSSKNELGRLARQFNAMLDVLQLQRTQLIEARTNLERQVGQRTAQLANANRRLVEVDRQRLRFLANVSHELRTPLTALRGEAEVTLRGATKSGDAYREALVTIVGQTVSMGRLVDDLLFMARSDSGNIQFDFRQIALAGVLTEVLQQVGGLARMQDVWITAATVDPSLTVRADERRLKQVLLIVLDNALKYSEPERAVEIGVDDSDRQYVEVHVRNHGRGIDPKEIERVFDRFYRSTASRDVEGSGLGLPIARWIIEQHRGTIDLSSIPDEHTDVRIRLPRGES